MISHDLCLAWNWEYDADFAMLLDMACRSQGLSLLQITPDNLADVLDALGNQQLAFRAFLDRASDVDARFLPLAEWACRYSVYRINPHEYARCTWDKAYMHLTLTRAGLYTPYTIVLPPCTEQPVVPPVDLSPLGERFTIKPAHGGGGEGVVMEATSWDQVLAARQAHPTDSYLLQAHIVPTQLDARPAWFRVIYCGGQVYPCWWDTTTHVYTRVTPEEADRYGLGPLSDITTLLARLCGLDFFSTEISSSKGHFVIIDYVNDQIDLRLQSKTADGVPDAIVCDMAERLAGLVAARRGDAG